MRTCVCICVCVCVCVEAGEGERWRARIEDVTVEQAKQQLQADRVGVVPAKEMNDAAFKAIQEAKMSGKKLDCEATVSGLRKEVTHTRKRTYTRAYTRTHTHTRSVGCRKGSVSV